MVSSVLEMRQGMPAPVRRRHMVLTLPFWPTDCLKRADTALAGLTAPLVLYERQKGAMRLVAPDRAALEAGLHAGQSLADARALCPFVVARQIDRAFLQNSFAELADWHLYASPIVAVLDDGTPSGVLALDITGVSHLFAGETKMLADVTGRLKALGIHVQGAIAPSLGAAWALAHFEPGKIIGGADTKTALADLPVGALRISDEQAEGLERAGLKRIGQLYGRGRKALQARFGAKILLRLDQALGRAGERVVPRLAPSKYYAERRFAEPVELLDDVLGATGDLCERLCARLETAGLGGQSFHLLVFRSDSRVMHLVVNAARASRDAAHIQRLIANRAERLQSEFDAGFGIEMIRLMAAPVAPVMPVQSEAFEADGGAADLNRLYDRMTSRLGPTAVTRVRFTDTHIPERAVQFEPVMARDAGDKKNTQRADPKPLPVRPLRLLPRPEAIKVMAEVPDGPPVRMVWRRAAYRLVKASGPERIGAEWWQPGTGALTRDYYVAEDEEGRRFWVFREGLYVTESSEPRWFLHGLFA